MKSYPTLSTDTFNNHHDSIAKETEDRYRKVCERLEMMRETFKKAKFGFSDREGEFNFDSKNCLDLDDDQLPELLPIDRNNSERNNQR